MPQEFDHEVYYFSASHLDLGKIREEAEKRQRGDAYTDPVSTRLHFHSVNEPCKGQNHEQWGARGRN